MKKVNFFSTKAALMIAIVVSIFQSCKKDSKIELTSGGKDDISSLQQAVANSMGMPADKVVYCKDEKQFVVDDDGYITLEDARARFGSGQTGRPGEVNGSTQKLSYYLVSPSKIDAIKIYADETLPSEWITALDHAIMNWNATGSKVYMERIPTFIGATTVVVPYYTESSTVALSAYPNYWGRPGNRIRINTYNNSIDSLKKVFAITHELGHILGFSHTNGTYGYLVYGTPTSDPYSVMNATCLHWDAFTDYDLTAIRTVYPAY